MTNPVARLRADSAAVLVVDVQEKLLPAIPASAEFLRRLGFLLDTAKLLGVPVFATEQYPRGLGATVAELLPRLPVNRPAKTAFSCAGVLAETLRSAGRSQWLLTGLETHVCVLQTGLDLLAQEYEVFVPADSVAGRLARDHDLALRRLERAGAVVVTAEMAAFELCGDAGRPEFKELSRLVKELH